MHNIEIRRKGVQYAWVDLFIYSPGFICYIFICYLLYTLVLFIVKAYIRLENNISHMTHSHNSRTTLCRMIHNQNSITILCHMIHSHNSTTILCRMIQNHNSITILCRMINNHNSITILYRFVFLITIYFLYISVLLIVNRVALKTYVNY